MANHKRLRRLYKRKWNIGRWLKWHRKKTQARWVVA